MAHLVATHLMAHYCGHHLCQGFHLRTEPLYGLEVLVVCCRPSWLVVTLSVRFHLGTVGMARLLARKLTKSTLVLILVADHFCHLAQDLLVGDLAV